MTPYKVARNRWGTLSHYYNRPASSFQILERAADHCLVLTRLRPHEWQDGPEKTRVKVFANGTLEVWCPIAKDWIDQSRTSLRKRSVRNLFRKVYPEG